MFGTLAAALVVALVVGFRNSSTLRSVFGQEKARAQSGAPVVAPRPPLASVPERPVVVPPAQSAVSPTSAEPSKRVLRLEELPIDRETSRETSKTKAEAEPKARVRKPVKWRKRAPAAIPSAAPTASHSEPAPAPAAETITLDP